MDAIHNGRGDAREGAPLDEPQDQEDGGINKTVATVVVVAAGFAASVLHFATKSFSVILAASFAALFARHSSWQALTVFCVTEGVVESARPEKAMAQHISSIDRFFMSKLRVPSWVYVASSTGRKAWCLLAHGRVRPVAAKIRA